MTIMIASSYAGLKYISIIAMTPAFEIDMKLNEANASILIIHMYLPLLIEILTDDNSIALHKVMENRRRKCLNIISIFDTLITKMPNICQ